MIMGLFAWTASKTVSPDAEVRRAQKDATARAARRRTREAERLLGKKAVRQARRGGWGW
jgi:hypothetical protein